MADSDDLVDDDVYMAANEAASPTAWPTTQASRVRQRALGERLLEDFMPPAADFGSSGATSDLNDSFASKRSRLQSAEVPMSGCLQAVPFDVDSVVPCVSETASIHTTGQLMPHEPFSAHDSLSLPERLRAEVVYRTELCPQMSRTGICIYGSACTFAHGAEQLRRRKRSPKCGTHARTHTRVHARSTRARAHSHSHTVVHPLPSVLISRGFLSRYRTELCSNFERDGRCVYGKRCEFAHGSAQLLPSKYASRTKATAANP